MKKLIVLIAGFLLIGNTASANLIHITSIKNPANDGKFKRVGEYDGVFVSYKWCKDPGDLICPHIDAYGVPNSDAGEPNADLLQVQKDFVLDSYDDAVNSTSSSGITTITYVYGGVTKVMTAQFIKNTTTGDFEFAVVENDSYTENLAELNELPNL